MSTSSPKDHQILRGRLIGHFRQEANVRSLYELAPYPDLGAELKDPTSMLRPVLADLESRLSVAYLEAGCGTGHLLVGVAKKFPAWKCHGIDLSDSSLAIAQKLSDKHHAPVALHRISYIDPLPFEKGSIDFLSAQGTIHHCDDPARALKNLAEYLKGDGYISMHLYGLRLDRRKFDLKEAISLFEPELSNHSERFEIYRALIDHDKSINRIRAVLDISLLDIFRWLRQTIINARRRLQGVSWSPSWTLDYREIDSPWVDHFCHPCERAYEVPDIRRLVKDAGLRVTHMMMQGRVDFDIVPPELREKFESLSSWDQSRYMELMGPTRSFSMILRKI